ncbi:MAG TPA: 3-hydroxyacyl-CoA dehydrogenase NAD-binding domain-containing protein [Terriglobales bacterium]|nr:3-hydroxyacyl-CoA dehydrogenase NAD-binding domain-containing protein [Terriglobales bacterium]
MPEVCTIAVIGAGPVGQSIAQAVARAGYRTLLEDLLPASLRRAEAGIRRLLTLAVEQGRTTRAQADAALARIQYTRSLEEAARAADLVIEAVPDELESKLEIFLLLDKMCRPQTILASSTSSFSPEEIAAVTWRPGKCLGMHLRDTAADPPRVEIVPTRQTEEEVLAAVTAVARLIDGSAALVPESAAFVPAGTPEAKS